MSLLTAALTDSVKAAALELGFDLVTAGPATPPEHGRALRRWLEAGHAGTMGYPDHVVRGAWSGISSIAPRYTTGDWPFDGSMQAWLDGA